MEDALGQEKVTISPIKSLKFLVLLRPAREPAGHRIRQLLRCQAPPAQDHISRLCTDVYWHLHHRSTSLRHWTVSEKQTITFLLLILNKFCGQKKLAFIK